MFNTLAKQALCCFR